MQILPGDHNIRFITGTPLARIYQIEANGMRVQEEAKFFKNSASLLSNILYLEMWLFIPSHTGTRNL